MHGVALLAACLICPSYELRIQIDASAKSGKSSTTADRASSSRSCAEVEADPSGEGERGVYPLKSMKVIVLLLLAIKTAVAYSPSSSVGQFERVNLSLCAVGSNLEYHHSLNIVASSDGKLNIKTLAPIEDREKSDPLQVAWDAQFQKLERFYAEHGHANVPSTYATSPQLASWVGRQRQLHRKGQLPKHRHDAMLSLAFEFDPWAVRWEERFAEYANASRAAASSRGDGCGRSIPQRLRQWAARQRKAHAAGKLSLERIEALNQIQDWMWTPPSARRPSALRRLGLRLAKEISGKNAQDGISGEPLRANAATNLCYSQCASVGHALVISVSPQPETRATKELEDACEALGSLGYTVAAVDNASASQLRASFAAHALLPDWQCHGSSVIALMCHGSDGKVECQDGQTVSLAELLGLFGTTETPALQGKPKIFLVQACHRGQQPVASHAASTLPSEFRSLQDMKALESLLDANRQLSEDHDYLWGYASTPGTDAYRGALFSAFRQVVYKYGRETSWLELLQRTNDKLSQWSVHHSSGHKLPSMEIRSTCRGAGFAPADLIDAELAKQDPVYFEGLDE